MREKHPIDERFASLYDAESAPPATVRDALAVRYGWASGRGAAPMWKPVLVAAIALILVSGAVTYSLQDEGDPSEHLAAHQLATTDQKREPGDAQTKLGAALVEAERPTISTEITTQEKELERAAPREHPGSISVSIEERANSDEERTSLHTNTDPDGYTGTAIIPAEAESILTGSDGSSHTLTTNTNPTAAVSEHVTLHSASPPFRAEKSKESHSGSRPTYNLETNAFPATFTESSTRHMTEGQAVPAFPLSIDPASALAPGVLDRRRLPEYVIPTGTWWVGAFAGVGTVNGTWKGTGTEEFNNAEKWKSTLQVGALIGRTWRSGWGVSAGVGLARMRSVFAYDDPGQTQEVIEIDTNWTTTQTPDAQYTLYTWSIDSVIGSEAGPLQRRDARNRYQAIQVPVMLSWHTTVRRFHYGAFGGLTAWIPTKREGLTLSRPTADGALTSTDLKDAQLDQRFAPQIHGRAGIGAGFSLSEFLSIHVEPMVSVPLVSFSTDPTPWPTQTFIQFRLQYELPASPR